MPIIDGIAKKKGSLLDVLFLKKRSMDMQCVASDGKQYRTELTIKGCKPWAINPQLQPWDQAINPQPEPRVGVRLLLE